ncbi:hypothetical protein ACFLZQ_07615 [Thermodesulfobacteriota bacterium]
MKKLIIVAITSLVIFACFHNSYARTYYRTFEVAEIRSDGIVLKDFEGGRFLIDKDPQGLIVGDIVRYDTVRNRLRKSPWQPAKVTKMTDRTITLQLKNGEKVDVNMRSNYRGEFKKGDTVDYKASAGQIKKKNLMKLDD